MYYNGFNCAQKKNRIRWARFTVDIKCLDVNVFSNVYNIYLHIVKCLCTTIYKFYLKIPDYKRWKGLFQFYRKRVIGLGIRKLFEIASYYVLNIVSKIE